MGESEPIFTFFHANFVYHVIKTGNKKVAEFLKEESKIMQIRI